MNKKSISNYRLVFFMSVSNIFIINLIALSRLFNRFTNIAWLIVILMIIFNIIFFLPFRGLPKGINLLKKVKTNYLVRMLMVLYLIFSITFYTIIVSLTVNKFFYFNTNVLITSFVILLTGTIISRESLNRIINIAILFFILIIPFYIIPFTHLEERDFSLLLPIYLKFEDLIYIIPLFMFPLEHLIHGIFCDQIDNGFSKKTLIMSCIIEGIYVLFIIIDAQTLIGANFYVDMFYPGIYRWLIYQGNKFIENNDIFLLMIILVTFIFKLTFYIFALRNLLFKKSKTIVYIIIFSFLFAIVSIFYIFNNFLNTISEVYLYVSLGILLIIYFYFIIIANKNRKITNKERINNEQIT